MDPYLQMGVVTGVLILAAWLASVIFKEYSWVDRLWSTAPIFFGAWVAGAADFADARLNLMAGLIALWGVRLTWNFWRKGGFSKGGEDYRWEVLRNKMNGTQWQLFNFFFTHTFQLTLIWGFTSPLQPAYQNAGKPLGTLDFAAAGLFLFFWLIEVISDEQMWNFQQAKKAKREAGEPVTQGFFREGLYRFSRHPNYFGELGMWWSIYLFGVGACGVWLNPSLIGVVVLTILFIGSIRFGESISSSKYANYKDYQATTSPLIPWFPGKASDTKQAAAK